MEKNEKPDPPVFGINQSATMFLESYYPPAMQPQPAIDLSALFDASALTDNLGMRNNAGVLYVIWTDAARISPPSPPTPPSSLFYAAYAGAAQ